MRFRGSQEIKNIYDNDSSILLGMSAFDSAVSASRLSNNSDKKGWLEKRNTSCLTSICPCFAVKWKRRYVILIGNYLFRFDSPQARKNKGVPIPLDTITVNISNVEFCFEICTIRKTYTFRASSASECEDWIKAIRKRKQLAIKEGMGHLPITADVELVNKTGSAMFDERIRRESEEYVSNPMSKVTPGY